MTPRRPRTPFVSRSRADGISRAQARGHWVQLLKLADEAGRSYLRTGALPRLTADELAHRVARHAGLGFPLGHASAADAAAGFRMLAKAFVVAAVPELKAALAEASAAAARCCLRMLELEEAQATARFARQRDAILGERAEED
jgi:hypothetical protein